MKRYRFTYESETSFSAQVTDHSFMLRATPLDCGPQHLLSHSLTVSPSPDSLSEAYDAWGARQHYGIVRNGHDGFRYRSEGIVEVHSEPRKEPKPSPVFMTNTPLTGFIPEMKALCAEGDSLAAAMTIAGRVMNAMTYLPGSTGVSTTAGEAFSQGSGVCQDFAHIMVAVCRECGIPARYVCGLVIGEGETHAWTEIWHDGAWYGIDATSGLRCDDRYITMAYGRDASDCSVCRGMFRGVALQRTSTKVVVEATDE